MGILTGKQIKNLMGSGKLILEREGGKEIGVNPASIDIHLSDKFIAFKYSHRTFVDSKEIEDPISGETVKPDGRHIIYHKYTDEYIGPRHYYVHDGDALLSSSEERLRLPDNVCGRFYGSTPLLKLGLEIKAASSWSEFLEPGYKGDLRIFFRNSAWMPIKVYASQVVGRLVLETVANE